MAPDHELQRILTQLATEVTSKLSQLTALEQTTATLRAQCATLEAQIGRIPEMIMQTKEIELELKSIHQELSAIKTANAKRDSDVDMIKKIVYGAVAMVLISVFGALIGMVVVGS